MTSPGASPPTQRHGISAMPARARYAGFDISMSRSRGTRHFLHLNTAFLACAPLCCLMLTKKYHIFYCQAALSGWIAQRRHSRSSPKPDKEALPYRAIINQCLGDDDLHKHSSTSPPVLLTRCCVHIAAFTYLHRRSRRHDWSCYSRCAHAHSLSLHGAASICEFILRM
jgi:hypothetical protein